MSKLWFPLIPLLIAVASPSPVRSQTIDVNRQNRTLEVVVTQKVEVNPDIANVTLGCVTYGATSDQAYQSNLERADKIIKALNAAGITKEQIESSDIDLSETPPGDIAEQTSSARRNRQFRAHQSWRVRLPASSPQEIIDVAVRAGANGIEYVSWDVADPEALEGRARASAMDKARSTASEIAKSAGTTLGPVLYASNVRDAFIPLQARTAALNTEAIDRARSASIAAFSLQLFPEKVEKQATVRVVFALE